MGHYRQNLGRKRKKGWGKVEEREITALLLNENERWQFDMKKYTEGKDERKSGVICTVLGNDEQRPIHQRGKKVNNVFPVEFPRESGA